MVLLGVFLGGGATFAATASGVDPVLASAGLTLAAWVLARGLPLGAFYCGSFVGMGVPGVVVGAAWPVWAEGAAGLAALAACAGVLALAEGRGLDGHGGRLGSIAFAGGVVAYAPILAVAMMLGASERGVLVAQAPGAAAAAGAVAASAAGAIATRGIARRLGSAQAVIGASAMVGTAAGLAGLAGASPLVTAGAYAGAFAGMTRADVLGTRGVAAAGAAAGAVLCAALPVLGGVGGLLGASALVGVLMVRGVARRS